MPTKEMERKKEEECNKSGDFYNVKIIAKYLIQHIISKILILVESTKIIDSCRYKDPTDPKRKNKQYLYGSWLRHVVSKSFNFWGRLYAESKTLK